METNPGISLPLLESATAGCSCCSEHQVDQPSQRALSTKNDMSTTDYRVAGMTCGHCVSAVTAKLTALPGVAGVSVELGGGGVSTVTVTSAEPLTGDRIAKALDAAGGYRLASD